MKRLYRVLWAALAVCLLLSVGVTGVSAAVDTPYDGYQYDEEVTQSHRLSGDYSLSPYFSIRR